MSTPTRRLLSSGLWIALALVGGGRCNRESRNNPSPLDGGGGGGDAAVTTGGDAGVCTPGIHDEGCACPKEGATQPCWPGDPAERGLGRCHDGTQICVATTSGEFTTLAWGTCQGARLECGCTPAEFSFCDMGVVSSPDMANPTALPDNAWPRFRHDNRNSGTTTAMVATAPKLKWKIFVGGTNLNTPTSGLASGPVVNQHNQIFIGAGEADMKSGSFYSFDSTGMMLYSFAANRGYGISTPAVRTDGTAYFSTTTSQLFAVDPSGMQLWKYATKAQADSDPIITAGGTLVYGSDDGSVYALDPKGALLWASDPTLGPGEVDGGLAETPDGRIVAGGKNGWFGLDPATGKTVWSVKLTSTHGALLSSPVVELDGTVYGVDSTGLGVAIDKMGNPIWQKQLGATTGPGGTTPAHLSQTLFDVLNDGLLHAYDDLTATEKWSRPINNGMAHELIQGPVVDGAQHLFINSDDGNVYAFDVSGNALWTLPTSGRSAPQNWSGTIAIGNDGTLYVPGNDGNLYAFQ